MYSTINEIILFVSAVVFGAGLMYFYIEVNRIREDTKQQEMKILKWRIKKEILSEIKEEYHEKDE